MRRTVHRRAVVGLIALMALVLPTAVPASAGESSRSGVIVLEGATSAEGITAGRGTTFYAGELRTGDIFKGDIREGKAKRFIDAPEGRMAVGMKFDHRNGLLFVAGGMSGKAYVYDTGTRKALPEIALTTKENSFINDVTLTRDGAWFTNSKYPELYFVSVDREGGTGTPKTRTLDDPSLVLKDPATQFGLNGIASARNGRVLIVAHSFNQALYTYEPRTKETSRIETGALPNVDGIVVRGKTVWAVQNQLNQISRIRLSHDLASGEVREVIKSPDFNVPATAALFGATLAAVNAQFGQPPGPHEVVLVPARHHHHGHD
ncbi:hypothetical protein FDW83_11870 [Pseudarthrobacter sp. NamE2]|uniref:hypothetical protein n=1 Tax=Pseudarthrobacter sp. NamE2 TaxID=2576838 RepID=UPI0010FD43D4|nr:hypothetical protein [Pseudarthrobacter sp. NamE2]TLM82646.1 hypothetical protein FDW83_11870 [Pseudarthrobacter sp. NamE2]